MSRHAFRIYQASPGDKQLTAVSKNGEQRAVSLATDVVNHSPTGIGFGYPGSGPAQTALSILCDMFGEVLASHPVHYQDLKFDIIAAQNPERPFKLNSQQIIRYILDTVDLPDTVKTSLVKDWEPEFSGSNPT